MNTQPAQSDHNYLICIDSDGCVFDTVFLKHSECLVPSIITDWGLNSIGRAVRHVVQFITQTSRHRGINRWRALLLTIQMLRDYPGVNPSVLPSLTALENWLDNDPKPSADSLRLALQKTSDPVLKKVLAWSENLDETADRMVNNLPPYEQAAQTIPLLAKKAEIHVVTQAPGLSVEKQWRQADLMQYVHTLHGQEEGAKAAILANLSPRQPEPNRRIMLGDAPGDLQAARTSGWLFYPILPEEENESWRKFRDVTAGQFFSNTYAGQIEKDAETAFNRKFSTVVPWQ